MSYPRLSELERMERKRVMLAAGWRIDLRCVCPVPDERYLFLDGYHASVCLRCRRALH